MSAYKHFELFIERNFVGPDLPGLELPVFEQFSEIEDIFLRVKKSLAFRRYAQKGFVDEIPPSRILEDYISVADTRSVREFVRVARTYFQSMAAGDLIIVPPSNFSGLAHIGEFTGPPNITKMVYPVAYREEPLTGRNVKWLATMEKVKLPAQALEALQKPSPYFLLAKHAWPAIFRRAYGSYAIDGEFGARFEITSDHFQTKDDFNIQAFFNFVTANTERVERGSEKVLSLREGAFEEVIDPPDLFTNVNSPGGLSLKSRSIAPIVIAVMLSLAVNVGPEAQRAAESDTIMFGNSLAPAEDDPCSVPVRRQVITQLRLLGYDRWAEACRIAQKAAHRTGVSSTVGIRNQ